MKCEVAVVPWIRASYQKQFADLAKAIFEHIMVPYEHEPKMLQAIIESRAMFNNMLKMFDNMLNKMGEISE